MKNENFLIYYRIREYLLAYWKWDKSIRGRKRRRRGKRYKLN